MKNTHKFGLRLPKIVDESYNIDAENGNVLYINAISKEMTGVKVAFKALDDGEDVPIGYAYVRCHIIFDVKMEDFRQKSRLVAGGHTTKTSDTMTYDIVVSSETGCFVLVISALNVLEFKYVDATNPYITAPIKEKVWTTLGPEFGHDAGKRALIVRALYNLNSAGSDYVPT